ncbi:hypothetical protein JHK85_007291 [Glycine max]|nr:hypothetical protein JHK85_007291 [Glycine max]
MNGPTMIPFGEELEKSDVGVDMLKFLVDLFHNISLHGGPSSTAASSDHSHDVKYDSLLSDSGHNKVNAGRYGGLSGCLRVE